MYLCVLLSVPTIGDFNLTMLALKVKAASQPCASMWALAYRALRQLPYLSVSWNFMNPHMRYYWL